MLNIGVLTTSYPRSQDDISGIFIHTILENTCQAKKDLHYQVIMPCETRIKKEEQWGNIKINRFSYFFPTGLQRLATDSGIPTDLSISFLAKIQLPFFLISFFFKTILKCRKCHILHAHFFPCGVIALAANFFLRKKTVLTLHGTDYRMLLKHKKSRILKLIMHKFDGIICLGSDSRNLIEDLKYPTQKIYASRLAINTKEFSPPKINKTTTALKVLWVGRITPVKNLDLLLDAIKILVDKKINLKLTLVGDGNEKPRLEEKAKNLKIDHLISWEGKVPYEKLPHFYQNTDIFVLTSISEGLPSSMLEAMSCERIVIVTDVGSISDVIKHKENGFIIQPKCPQELTDQVISIIQLKESERRIIGKNARKEVEREFASDSIANTQIAIYNAILEGS